MSRIVFVTGTNTGAGKTILTALLLAHLRSNGIQALAMKPVETGGRGDARLLHALQYSEVALDEVNPFWFRESLAPSIAARRSGQRLIKKEILRHVCSLRRRCDLLLIEGAGGLLSPLAKNWSGLDLIKAMKAEVVVAACNELGVINQARLTLDRICVEKITPHALVLMGGNSSKVCRENAVELGKMHKKVPIHEIPRFGLSGEWMNVIKRNQKKYAKTLAMIL
jgi:dethiobiotin synthetase|tara:strand:+ start:300 stop:971 length:672 start_codon:yes stop_codon:yes gene_type:complete